VKTKLPLRLAAVLGMLSLGPLDAWAKFEVTAEFNIHAKADFYASLAPVGTWVEVGSYGRCWHPVPIAVGWRPYCSGSGLLEPLMGGIGSQPNHKNAQEINKTTERTHPRIGAAHGGK